MSESISSIIVFLGVASSYLNENSGLITAIATIAIAWLTKTLARENRILRQAGTEPEVIAYLIPHPNGHGGINFVIENVGMGLAKDIAFTFEHDEEDFKNHKVLLTNDENRLNFSFLPAKEKIVCLFGISFELAGSQCNGEWLKPFSVKIEFFDINNKKHNKTCQINFAQYKGLNGVLDEPPIVALSKSLEKIEKHLGTISQKTQSALNLIDKTSFENLSRQKVKDGSNA